MDANDSIYFCCGDINRKYTKHQNENLNDLFEISNTTHAHTFIPYVAMNGKLKEKKNSLRRRNTMDD